MLIAAGFLLFRFRREQYYTLRNVCLLTGALGLVVFALFPVAPPRLTDLPLLDTVTQGAPGYRQILPPALVNQYAAMPSFHAGWNLAVGIVVFRASGTGRCARSPWRCRWRWRSPWSPPPTTS